MNTFRDNSGTGGYPYHIHPRYVRECDCTVCGCVLPQRQLRRWYYPAPLPQPVVKHSNKDTVKKILEEALKKIEGIENEQDIS